ncbi:MAG: DUF1289 domain-containing protein [Rhodospirillales bacterium]|nr:DUF1289 domain-containing protein [Rhodospirillales bacterium]
MAGDSTVKDAQSIQSPCIGVCKMDAAKQYCRGCYRTLSEIAAWSSESKEGQLKILGLVAKRQKSNTIPDVTSDQESIGVTESAE